MSYVSGNLEAGQKTGVDTTAGPVSTTSRNCREAIIQSDPTNTTNVLVGDSLAQRVVITPSQSITIPIISLSRVYVKMASGTGIVNWLARD
jgi:hypothetical protein